MIGDQLHSFMKTGKFVTVAAIRNGLSADITCVEYALKENQLAG